MSVQLYHTISYLSDMHVYEQWNADSQELTKSNYTKSNPHKSK